MEARRYTPAQLQLFEADVVSGEVRELGGMAGEDRSALWWYGTQQLLFLGSGSADSYTSDSALRLMESHTGESRIVEDDVRGDLYRAGADFALVRIEQGTRRLYRIAHKDLKPVALTSRDLNVDSVAISPDGKHMAVLMGDANAPEEIYLGSLGSSRFRQVTHVHDEQMSTYSISRAEKLSWRSRDDRFDIQGYLLKPPGFDASKRYPLLVNIHGGPAASYQNDFVDLRFSGARHSQMEAYAARGYLVLMPNHRGGSLYGREFRNALQGDYAGSYQKDIEPGVDHVLAMGFADPDRLGILGGSYGGYETAFAITLTGRYRAASSNDGPFNLYSRYGFQPSHKPLSVHFLDGTPRERTQSYIDLSPVFQAAKIRTPTLLRSGNVDGTLLPYPYLVSALELYTALKDEKVPVELVVHPYEGHGIEDVKTSRDYLERNLDWFDFWLNCREDPQPVKTRQYERWRTMRAEQGTSPCLAAERS